MIKNVIFDCDSTLTKIEGVDVLADMNGVWNEVSVITRSVMDKASMSQELYESRLKMITPTLDQVREVGDLYVSNITDDAKEVVAALRRAGKNVYMLTAGLQPAVFILARHLGIEYTRVHSVPVYFDEDGVYSGFDGSSPLVNKYGKCEIVRSIKQRHGGTAFIGDGMTDCEAADEADFFIGFGGVIKRKNVLERSEIYIESPSLAPVVNIILDEDEKERLTTGESGGRFRELLERGHRSLENGAVKKK